jgi:uncharacterized MnhB-related membrane protein
MRPGVPRVTALALALLGAADVALALASIGAVVREPGALDVLWKRDVSTLARPQ